MKSSAYGNHLKTARHVKKSTGAQTDKVEGWSIHLYGPAPDVALPHPESVVLKEGDDPQDICPQLDGSAEYWRAVEAAEKLRMKASEAERKAMVERVRREGETLPADRRRVLADDTTEKLFKMQADESAAFARAGRARRAAEAADKAAEPKTNTAKPTPKAKKKSEAEEKPKNPGTERGPCPFCDTLLVSETTPQGAVVWSCPNPDCEPPPPLEMLTKEQKAEMKAPGRSMWNDFQKYVSGWGYSSDQIRDMYRQHRDEMRNRSDGEKPKETLFEAECKKRKSRPDDLSPPLQPQAYAGPSSSASTVSSPPHRVAGQDCFDLNRVTKEQLVTLDGIGSNTADTILAKRQELQSKGLCFMSTKDC